MFKRCNKCGNEWETRQSFLDDKGVELIGYQVHFEELTLGLFLFNHSCRTTMALTADLFTELYDGPVFRDRATGGEDCPEYCLDENCLLACETACECAYIREVMQIIREWKPAGKNKR